jgi:hypothetical protein
MHRLLIKVGSLESSGDTAENLSLSKALQIAIRVCYSMPSFMKRGTRTEGRRFSFIHFNSALSLDTTVCEIEKTGVTHAVVETERKDLVEGI